MMSGWATARVFGVRLLLVDLDNTLIDRAGAVDRWAREFAAAHGGDTGDAAWLVTADAGWAPFVVTNGTVAQQERKLRHTGLDREVAGWVISEGVGLRKPDPAIFRLTVEQAGQSLDGAWMIGDSAQADIEGARGVGLPGVWLHRGRPWPLTAFEPGHVADSFPHAVDIVLGR
jgi:putative hydrolase of the HAD superfamily